MKRLLIAALCLGMTNVATAQFLENFDGGTFPPTGWTTYDNSGAGNLVWQPSSVTSRGNLCGGVGESACYDAFDYAGTFGALVHDSYLVSPPISIPTAGYSAEFNLNFQDFAGVGDFDFDVSADGGATWTNIATWTADTPSGGVSGAYDIQSFDLSAYAGQFVNLRFRYWATATSLTSIWFSQIDTVRVTLTPITPADCGFMPVWSEDFDSGTFPPVGWSSTDYSSNGTLVWVTSAATTRGNVCGGDGEAAAYDGNDYGTTLGVTQHDSDLVSAPFAIPAGPHSLEFDMNHQDNGGVGDIDFDISTDGGVTWTTLWTWTHDMTPPPRHFVQDLTAYGGQTVQVRFRFYAQAGGSPPSPTWVWYVQVDNLELWPNVPVWTEDFDSGVFPPAGWATTDYTTNGTLVWTQSSATTRGNLTGGNGDGAAYDGYDYGAALGVIMHDSDLVTAPFTVPATGASYFEGDFDFQDNGTVGDFSIEVSADGGVTWTLLETWTDDMANPPHRYVYDFTPYAGLTVQVRFRFWATPLGTPPNPTWVWYVYMDNLKLRTNNYPLAKATQRNDAGNGNPNIYSVSAPPVLGGTFTADIDTTLTGHGYAQLFGYAGPFSFTLSGGQTILIDITHPGGEALALPIVGAPGGYFINVPNVCAFVGFELSTQAAAFNIPNNTPWILTNAQDFVVGF